MGVDQSFYIAKENSDYPFTQEEGLCWYRNNFELNELVVKVTNFPSHASNQNSIFIDSDQLAELIHEIDVVLTKPLLKDSVTEFNHFKNKVYPILKDALKENKRVFYYAC